MSPFIPGLSDVHYRPEFKNDPMVSPTRYYFDLIYAQGSRLGSDMLQLPFGGLSVWLRQSPPIEIDFCLNPIVTSCKEPYTLEYSTILITYSVNL